MSLPTPYQSYIHMSRYARWNNEDKRRETWEETIDRYITFFADKYEGRVPVHIWEEVATSILDLEVMPSMRCLMSAGKALARDNVAGFNCSYLSIDSLRSFDELMYVLMCGTGVGFSVERKNVKKIPAVAEEFTNTESTIVVADSKIGWAKSLRELYSLLHTGQIPNIDYSRVRPAGAVLKTFGGRASGPEPLRDLFEFSINIFRNSAGRQLTSIECHDLVCKIAEIVVVGGVRRSALISLSDIDDDRMRAAKVGSWWENNVQRALANNSAVYKCKPDMNLFLKEWVSLYESKSGERGIFNRAASLEQARKNDRRDTDGHEYGTNPCSEIILRDKQFCNLSEVVVRAEDTAETLEKKVRIATFLGTLQSGLTDLRYLSKKWVNNTEEECLLGVSLTGIMDNKMMASPTPELKELLNKLREAAVDENKKWASKLGVNQSVAITCVKPSGTVSQLVDSASGIHTRHSPYYVRTVRADKKDPLAQFMVEQGFPVEDDVTKPEYNYVFSFPVKAPDNALFRDSLTAREHMELWLLYAEEWCEHKPSVTISVKEDEWMDVGAFTYQEFDRLSGVSFLPYSEHTYQQAPYQDCTKEEYEALLAKIPTDVNWDGLAELEKTDHTTATQELACVGGNCEI